MANSRPLKIPFTYLWSRTTQERDRVIYENPAKWWDFEVKLKANKLRFMKDEPVNGDVGQSMRYLRCLLHGQSPKFVSQLTNVPTNYLSVLYQNSRCGYHEVYVPRLAKLCRHTLPKELTE